MGHRDLVSGRSEGTSDCQAYATVATRDQH
jgi:hypothetical protein